MLFIGTYCASCGELRMQSAPASRGVVFTRDSQPLCAPCVARAAAADGGETFDGWIAARASGAALATHPALRWLALAGAVLWGTDRQSAAIFRETGVEGAALQALVSVAAAVLLSLAVSAAWAGTCAAFYSVYAQLRQLWLVAAALGQRLRWRRHRPGAPAPAPPTPQ